MGRGRGEECVFLSSMAGCACSASAREIEGVGPEGLIAREGDPASLSLSYPHVYARKKERERRLIGCTSSLAD